MGAKIKKCKKKENRGELNCWTGNRQQNPTSEIQRDMIQQQDRPKELLYVVTPALTASLPCNTMTYNDILYVSLCMYHYVSIYINIYMYHYDPLCTYDSICFQAAGDEQARDSGQASGQMARRLMETQCPWNQKATYPNFVFLLHFAIFFIIYFALLYRHCHPMYSTCPAYGGL